MSISRPASTKRRSCCSEPRTLRWPGCVRPHRLLPRACCASPESRTIARLRESDPHWRLRSPSKASGLCCAIRSASGIPENPRRRRTVRNTVATAWLLLALCERLRRKGCGCSTTVLDLPSKGPCGSVARRALWIRLPCDSTAWSCWLLQRCEASTRSCARRRAAPWCWWARWDGFVRGMQRRRSRSSPQPASRRSRSRAGSRDGDRRHAGRAAADRR